MYERLVTGILQRVSNRIKISIYDKSIKINKSRLQSEEDSTSLFSIIRVEIANMSFKLTAMVEAFSKTLYKSAYYLFIQLSRTMAVA